MVWRSFRAALLEQPDAADIPRSVWCQKWVVDVQPAGTGRTALKYLAAYVNHTALGSQRILNADEGQVTFKYKDSGDQQWRTLRLTATEFLRRFLQHVLPKGFRRIRYFGWLTPAAKARWAPSAKKSNPQRHLSPITPGSSNHR